jgi:hypothetical protein
MNVMKNTLESFYFCPFAEIYYAVFEDGYIHHGRTNLPWMDDMSTIAIDGRVVINLHLNEDGFYVNYYHDVDEGSEASVYDGQDYYCDVRVLDHSIPPKEEGEYPAFQVEYFQKRDGAKYFAKWAKDYCLHWSK